VSIEYPSIEAFAEAYSKTNASSEYQAWVKGLDKVRRIVFDSLYNEWQTTKANNRILRGCNYVCIPLKSLPRR